MTVAAQRVDKQSFCGYCGVGITTLGHLIKRVCECQKMCMIVHFFQGLIERSVSYKPRYRFLELSSSFLVTDSGHNGLCSMYTLNCTNVGTGDLHNLLVIIELTIFTNYIVF